MSIFSVSGKALRTHSECHRVPVFTWTAELGRPGRKYSVRKAIWTEVEGGAARSRTGVRGSGVLLRGDLS